MQTIGASYDWSIQKPKAPCASPGLCNQGAGHFAGAIAPGGAGYPMPYQQGWPATGCQSCQAGPLPAQQPSVFRMNPQPPASGIGPANTYPAYPDPENYGPEPAQPGFGQQQNPYDSAPGQYGMAPEPQQPQRDTGPMSGLPSPGYTDSNGVPATLPFRQNQPSAPGQFPQPNTGPPGTDAQQRGGALTPGFSGNLPGLVRPGKLGPPDEFKSDPPAWQYPAPQQ